jgi:hypothetical protein
MALADHLRLRGGGDDGERSLAHHRVD